MGFMPLVENVRPIEQEFGNSCAATTLTMNLRALKIQADEIPILSIVGHSYMCDSRDHGNTPPQLLAKAAKLYGCQEIHGLNLSFKFIEFATESLGLPVIVLWMTDLGGDIESDCHYSLHCGPAGLADPSFGTWTKLGQNNFERKWLSFENGGKEMKRFGMLLWNPEITPATDILNKLDNFDSLNNRHASSQLESFTMLS